MGNTTGADKVLAVPGESVEPRPKVTEPKTVPDPASVCPAGTIYPPSIVVTSSDAEESIWTREEFAIEPNPPSKIEPAEMVVVPVYWFAASRTMTPSPCFIIADPDERLG